jgi:hypothetical protein
VSKPTKYRVEKIRVEQYKSGEHEGEYRQFELPEGAIVLGSHVVMIADQLVLTITVAVPV